MKDNIILILLCVSGIMDIMLMAVIEASSKKKNQIKTTFSLNLVCLLIVITGQLLQMLFAEKLNIQPVYFDYFVYIGTCLLPITFLFTGLVFINTKIKFKKKYILLFIIPIISLLILWTNDYHHLFYQEYSVNLNETISGPYLMVHNIYSYLLLLIGMIYLLRYSIKNSGLFSKQSILIVLGASVPIIINILGTLNIVSMSIYITPISFTVTMIFIYLAMFKFQFLSVAPIALQKIVDRISDSYLVINEEYIVTDFNATLLKTFKLKSKDVRTKNILDLCQEYGIEAKKLREILKKLKVSEERQQVDIYIENIDRYFTAEISVINQNGQVLGAIILLKDVTQHIIDVKTIQEKQEILMEKERLSALGQMIGGIAHNLKTPIFSIAGAMEGILKLTKEINESLGNPQVVEEDYREITGEIDEWIVKVKSHLKYMSDIITAVKGQAVNFNLSQDEEFTIEKFLILENVLMKYELKSAGVEFHIDNKCDEQTVVKGNINSLIQVINNMISNSIQAYEGKQGMSIDMIIRQEENNLIISIQDYGPGLPDIVLEKLFKEMITTKGKNGSGLGLYMSYSNIKAHFKGDITVETSHETGTRFNIIIPLR
ncbi:MAG: PAS domain-containing protein [Clostridia bacterium]|nr:PAS domain-containing protein [Clostridia bacterium]